MSQKISGFVFLLIYSFYTIFCFFKMSFVSTTQKEKYILLYDNKIVILDEQTGLVLNTVLIETIYFIIDTNDFINVFDEANKRVYSYDLNGICVKETKLENFDDNFGFNMDKNDRLNFFDWTSNSIYYS